jgi:chromosome segregation ATPase
MDGGLVNVFEARKKSFNDVLSAISDEFISLGHHQHNDGRGSTQDLIRHIDNRIQVYITSERETLLSSMLNQQRADDERSEFRDRLIAFSADPSRCQNLSTANLVSHFFYDAALMRSLCFELKAALADFSHGFRAELTELRGKVRSRIGTTVSHRSSGVALPVDVTQAKHADIYCQLKTLASSYSTVKEKLQVANRELADARLANERLEKALKEETQETQVLSESLRRMIAKGGPGKKVSIRHRETMDELDATVHNLQQELEAAHAETAVVRRDLRRKEREVNRINDRLQVAKRQALTLQTVSSETAVKCANDCLEVKEENKRLVRKMDELEAEIDFLKQSNSKVNSLLFDSTNHYEGEIKKLTEQLTHERSVAKRTTQALENRVKLLEKAKGGLCADITRLEAELVKERHESALLERKMSSQANVLLELRTDNAELSRLRR